MQLDPVLDASSPQLPSQNAAKIVPLLARFRHAVKWDAAVRGSVMRALRHPEIREVIRNIMREESSE